MNNVDLQKLVDKAGKMALGNIWGENAYEINMAILKIDHNNCAACTRLAKYYKLNDNMTEAKNMYLKALDIDPNSRVAINNLFDIEKDQKESEAVDKINTMEVVTMVDKSPKNKEKKKKKAEKKTITPISSSIEPVNKPK